MENIIVAIITSMATLLVAIIGLIGSRKLTKKSSVFDQSKLIATLKDTMVAQTERIRLLEAAHDEQIHLLQKKDQELNDLKERVSKLEQLTIEQALTISKLSKRGRLPKAEGGEVETDEDDRTEH